MDTGFFSDAPPLANSTSVAGSPPSSIDDVSSNEIEPTEQSELAAFVRQFIEADDTIAELNKSTESTRQRIRELKKKKTQLSRVIAAIMDKADIDMLEPEGRDGSSIGRLTCVRSTRKKPTVSALEKTILEEVCGGCPIKLKEFQQRALERCEQPVATIRRTRRK